MLNTLSIGVLLEGRKYAIKKLLHICVMDKKEAEQETLRE